MLKAEPGYVEESGRISAVIFDLLITLTGFEAERRRPEMLVQLGDTLGADGLDFEKAMRTSFTERATGQLGDLRSTLIAVCGRLGINPTLDQLDAAVALRISHERDVLRPRDGVIDVLAGLRARGFSVGIITDCSTELPELWPSLPYSRQVDAVVFSCQAGYRKPHPSLYHDAAARLGVDPSRCLYVGDGGSSELTGASAVGMTAVLLKTPFSGEFRYDPDEYWNGPSISHLGEINRFLV
jgi:putative hydrolase of the HAD superfamily